MQVSVLFPRGLDARVRVGGGICTCARGQSWLGLQQRYSDRQLITTCEQHAWAAYGYTFLLVSSHGVRRAAAAAVAAAAAATARLRDCARLREFGLEPRTSEKNAGQATPRPHGHLTSPAVDVSFSF